jgi:predicted amidohydrolase
MNKEIKVLGVQTEPVLGDKEANIAKVESLLEKYSWFKPDLVVLPEVFTTGIVPVKVYRKQAEEVPGPTTEKMSAWAKELGCYFLGGSIIEACKDGKCRNRSNFYAPDGSLIASYYKQHMFNYYGSNEGEFCSPGFETVIARTPVATFGLTICFDLRFTELYRVLANNGVDIILVPAAWPYPRLEHWVVLNRARALENQCFVVAVNQVGQVPPRRMNVGNSMVIDPWGSVLASAGEKEGVMMAEIDLERVYTLRKEFPLLEDRNHTAYQNVNVCEYSPA